MFCTIIPFDEPPPEDVANDDGPDAQQPDDPVSAITLRELWLVIWLAAICIWIALTTHGDDDPDGDPLPKPANDDFVDMQSSGAA